MWFAKSQEEVLTELAVDPATGLSSEEAQKRLDKYRRNKLRVNPKKYHSAFLCPVAGHAYICLLGATVITLLIQEYVDASIILWLWS